MMAVGLLSDSCQLECKWLQSSAFTCEAGKMTYNTVFKAIIPILPQIMDLGRFTRNRQKAGSSPALSTIPIMGLEPACGFDGAHPALAGNYARRWDNPAQRDYSKSCCVSGKFIKPALFVGLKDNPAAAGLLEELLR